MKVGSSGVGRPVRWFIVLLCLGGAVFAAENNWLTTLKVGHAVANWLEQLTSDSTTRGDLDLPAAPIQNVDANPTNSWVQTALFSRPASTWTLDPLKASGASMVRTQQQAPAVSTFILALPTAFFSAGYISYSPSTDILGPVPNAPTATGTWTSPASGVWSNPANWAGGVIADGAGSSANFDTLDITSDVTVTLDSSRTIGSLSIGDTNGTHHYFLDTTGGSILTFDSNVLFTNALLQQTATSGGDTIGAPILLASAGLNINNYSTSHELVITGNIGSASATTSDSLIFNLDPNTFGSVPGQILVNGVIAVNDQTFVGVAGGTVIFTGTNTYKGQTSVDSGGTLLVNGDNSAATGNVSVSFNGTLGGTGQVGGEVRTFGGTITGGTATGVGQLTLLGNVRIRTEEGSGIYLANLSGSLSDLLSITGTLFLGGESALHIVGAADGMTIYTLATFAAHDGVFDPSMVTGIPTGYDLVYHDFDIQLIPTAIPEASTWIGGALALGVIAFAQRRKLRGYWLSVIG